MAADEKPALIAGGGIAGLGGLAAALGLAQEGIGALRRIDWR